MVQAQPAAVSEREGDRTPLRSPSSKRPIPTMPIYVVRTVEDLKDVARSYSHFSAFSFDVETYGGRDTRREERDDLCESRCPQIRTDQGRKYWTFSHRCQLLPGHSGDHMHPSGKRHWDEAYIEKKLNEAKRLGLLYREKSTASTKDKPPLDARTNTVWCMSLAGPGRSDVIPMGHPDPARKQLNRADVFDILRPLFFSDRRKVNQNVGFDLLSIAKYYKDEHGIPQIPPPPYADVMTMMFLLNENLSSYKLGALTEVVHGFSYAEKLGEAAYHSAWRDAMQYSHLDAKWAWMIWWKMSEKLYAPGRERLAALFDLEMQVLAVLMDMRFTGAYVDSAGFRRLRPLLKEQLAILAGEIEDMVGHPINLNSTQQLGRYLYDEQRMRCPKYTEKGGRSTDADTLRFLTRRYPSKKAPVKLLAHKEVSKLLSTYVDGFLPCIDDDSRIRASFNQARAKTGRLSCSEPNLQNIPARYKEANEEGKMIRRLFIAPPGRVLIVADYSQIELRILAHQTRDPRLVHAYTHGLDLHTQTASLIWRIPPGDVDPEKRAIAKNSNFNFAFEGGPGRVVAMSGIPMTQAQEVYDGWHRAYPGVKKWGRRIKDFCWQHGYVETLYGRKRRLPEIVSQDYAERGYAERQAVNHPIQGTAADIAKVALVEVHRVLHDFDAALTLQVHDEFVVECNKGQVDDVLPLIKTAMENIQLDGQPVLRVPLEVNIGVGSNWSEAK